MDEEGRRRIRDGEPDRAQPEADPDASADAAARPDRAPSGATPPAPVADEIFYCDLCGNAMLNLHCKLICERCGYKRDCSDP